LITIGGFLGYLEEDATAGNTEKLRNDIQRINGATNKMKSLLDELLELSRIGRLMNSPENTPFEEIVHDALERLEGQLRKNNVTVEVSSELPVVYGDRARLVEVVQNLVDNSAKFMGDQAQPQIEIGADKQYEEYVFFVKDNGIGIDPQYHDKIFELFDKLEPNSEGTGIGLALVKRIINVHEGEIWVESQGNGSGATFYFTLPLKPNAKV
jgi:signal transduction histidine kinase